MLVVQVFVHVKDAEVEEFINVTVKNASESVREPGIARFDVLQQQDDPTRFVLTEVYRTVSDPLIHKETNHYHEWREKVEPMMAEPRKSIKYLNIYPDELGWD